MSSDMAPPPLRTVRIGVVSVSDRASTGVYEEMACRA